LPVPAVLGQEAYSLIDQTQLQDGQSYTYFAIALYGDGVKSDASNLVTIVAINDKPTLTGIANQTIYANSNTGPLAFTVGDEAPASVVLTGTSSNQTLVPNANIVFGGSGASRTVTVTPALDQTGTTTITITATDGAGNTVITPITFLLTVKPLVYDFTGFLSPLTVAGTDASPTSSGAFNIGKAIPIKWQLRLGGTIVTALSSLRDLVAVPGNTLNNATCVANGAPTLFLLDPATGRPTGNSTYRFDTNNQQFIFNWDTSVASKTNCYRIRLTLNDNTAARVTIVRFK
jgi:hypothetical protein